MLIYTGPTYWQLDLGSTIPTWAQVWWQNTELDDAGKDTVQTALAGGGWVVGHTRADHYQTSLRTATLCSGLYCVSGNLLALGEALPADSIVAQIDIELQINTQHYWQDISWNGTTMLLMQRGLTVMWTQRFCIRGCHDWSFGALYTVKL